MAPKDPLSEKLWQIAKARYPVGSRLTGTVVYQAPFGVFLSLDLGHVHALLLRPAFADAPDVESDAPLPAERIVLRVPEMGEAVTVTVLGYREGNHQIDVIAKPPFHTPR